MMSRLLLLASLTGVTLATNDAYDVRTAKPKCAASISVTTSTAAGGCTAPKLNEPVAVALGVFQWRLCGFAGGDEDPDAAPALSLRSVLECNERGLGCYCTGAGAGPEEEEKCGMDHDDALDTLQQGVAAASCYPTPATATAPGGCDSSVFSGQCARYAATGGSYRPKAPLLPGKRAAHIQTEVEDKGPVAVRFSAPANLSTTYVAGAVFDTKEPRDDEGWDDFYGLVLGWGSASSSADGSGDGTDGDYWILQMPFGDAFGANGTMLYQRGSNLNGIESEPRAVPVTDSMSKNAKGRGTGSGGEEARRSGQKRTMVRAHISAADETAPAQTAEAVAALNARPGASWKAGLSPFFADKSVADYKRLLGIGIGNDDATVQHRTRTRTRARASAHSAASGGQELPESFDARTHWPSCSWAIRNQGDCGSCWAFGAVESLQNRMCIGTGGKVDVPLSAQNMLECACEGCEGCMDLLPPWEHLEATGVVSEACYPYKYCDNPASVTCSNSSTSITTAAAADAAFAPASVSGSGSDTCKFEQGGVCTDSSVSFTEYKSLPGAADSLSGEALMQAAILRNGPIECTFKVDSAFRNYESGVFDQCDEIEGGHAIKVVGWGVDGHSAHGDDDGRGGGGKKYWIVANSWSAAWGMDGYFLYERGNDLCSMESDCGAGLPSTAGLL